MQTTKNYGTPDTKVFPDSEGERSRLMTSPMCPEKHCIIWQLSTSHRQHVPSPLPVKICQQTTSLPATLTLLVNIYSNQLRLPQTIRTNKKHNSTAVLGYKLLRPVAATSGLICTWQLHAASRLRSATYISKHAAANHIATPLLRDCSRPSCCCSKPASWLL